LYSVNYETYSQFTSDASSNYIGCKENSLSTTWQIGDGPHPRNTPPCHAESQEWQREAAGMAGI
jgi:hypothetical protein